ncbi:hypothetical protein MHLP_03375 [Candidatus Mycoplasma haematolamae str. Purdue]|uniref:Uncharacterized protein n=1 Tax=Mycoplasma haematolamae (strain Purdue) TaxID=1212765 RepID=I7BAD4_MYCHA|nr:hypothetical protein [Candidatus Mycoplasma haematolamae]AFO52255.1 hypothetical protein MHLP_03375 [Candidatus Mycoplasma haematolamae str. Purdue]
MILTTKAQLGVALASLGGANAAAITVFKEPIKDLFLHQDSLDLVNGTHLDSKNTSLELATRSRRGLESSGFSSSLSSPFVDFSANQPSIELERLVSAVSQTTNFQDQVGSFKGELEKERQALTIDREQKEKVKQSIQELQKHRSDFDSAVRKLKVYLDKKPGTQVRALSKREREALAASFKVWKEVKELGESTATRLAALQGDTTRSRRSSHEQKIDGERLLQDIRWTADSIKFMAKDYNSGGNINWGFDMPWDKNPWKPFFGEESKWKTFWNERDSIKGELFKSYYTGQVEFSDEWSGEGCNYITAILRDDQRQYCLAKMTNRAGNVFGEANVRIEFQVAQQILKWMNYSLET